MVVDDLVRTLGRDGFREQIVDGLGSGAAAVVALAFAPATNGADGFQTGQKTDALQPADMVGDDGALRFYSLTLAVDRRLTGNNHLGLWVGEIAFDIAEHRGLVAFQRLTIMAAPIDDLFGGFPLTTHRIAGHRASRKVQAPQKPRNRRHLVRFLPRRDLPKD